MKNIVLFIFTFLIVSNLNAQKSWLRSKYCEMAYSKMLKTELRLIDEINEDTVFVLCFNAAVHNSSKVFPHVLWYHKEDSIIAYMIRPFHKKKHIVWDTILSTSLANMPNLERSDKGGSDLIEVYLQGKWNKSIIVNQEYIYDSCAEISVSKRLQRDIVLLRKYIPQWISRIPDVPGADT